MTELITRDDLDQALDRTVTTLRGEINQATTMLRGEIVELRTELRGEIVELRTELRGEISELRTELRGEMTELRGEMTELRGEMADLRGDLNQTTTTLRGEMTELRGEMVAMEVRLCVQIQKSGSEIAREVAHLMTEQFRTQISVVDEKYQDLPRQHAQLRGDFDAHAADAHMHRRRPATPGRRARRS